MASVDISKLDNPKGLKIVSLKNNPRMYKILDSEGKQVSDLFSNMIEAEWYLVRLLKTEDKKKKSK